MPSDAYLKAAAEGTRTPVLLMAVETADSIKRTLTTQGDWQAAAPSAGLNTAAFPGKVTLDHQFGIVSDGFALVYNSAAYSEPMPFDCYLEHADTLTLAWMSSARFSSITTRLVARLDGRDGPIAGYSEYFTLAVQSTYVITHYECSATINRIDFPPSLLIPSGSPVYLFLEVPVGTAYAGKVIPVAGTIGVVAPSGSLHTQPVDLGLVPSQPSVISIDDIIPPGNTIAVTARGSNDASVWADLGAVADGGILPPYRYYDFAVSFASDGTAGGRLDEIGVAGGNSQFRYYSTHRDEPVAGAMPYLKTVSTLTSKIELMKAPTTGEITATLAWVQETSDLLATGYLKNKAVLIKMGFLGLAEAEYQTIFTGSWYDYAVAEKSREITVKLRDVLKKFAKRKVPAETFDQSTGQKVTTPIEFNNVNVFQAFLTLFDQMGIPSRYIDRAEFERLRDEVRPGAEWNVTRTLGGAYATGYREPQDSDKLLEELMAVAGVFLVPMPDGRLRPILYDPAGDAVATLDANFCDFGNVDGGQKELYTRQYIYHSPLKENAGDNPEDYGKGYLFTNATAEIAWGDEPSEKYFYDRWNASETALQALAARMDSWFANPHARVTVDVPPRYAGVLPGQIVAVDNLRLPVAAEDWPGLTAGRKMLVMSRRLDPKTGKLTLDLMDLDSGGSQGAGTWAGAVLIAGPELPFGLTNAYTAVGTPPYTWRTSLGRLTVTGTGTGTANLDVEGLTGSGALSVTDANGTSLFRFTIPPAAVQNFLIGQQPDGTRQFSWLIDAAAAGYRIRYAAGSGGEWATMGPLHTGLLTASPWETGQLAVGTYTFAIRAVDALGNESGVPVYIEATLAEPREAYIVAAESARALGWPGTLTDCHIENGILIADDPTTWASLGTWAAAGAWSPAPISPIGYEHPAIDLGAVIAVTPIVTAIGATTITLEMSTSADGSTWSAWSPAGFVAGVRYVKLRASVAGDRPTLSALDLQLSTRPLVEEVNDLDTSTLTGAYRIGVGDVRIPYAKGFQKITQALVTLQGVGAGWSWDLVDKNVATGPRIRIFNAAGAAADAVIDVFLRGL